MSASRLAPAAYPMVDEEEATGSVAAVYSSVLEHFPMVPSLFKSLACHPTYLALAWEQAQQVLDIQEFASAANSLVERARGLARRNVSTELHDVLGGFEEALARMLLVAAGLQLALDGTITGQAAAPARGDGAGEPEPRRDVPSTGQLDAELVGAIRRDLATPIVNSVWRAASLRGLDGRRWGDIAVVTREDWFAPACDALEDAARDGARRLQWRVVASREAMRARDVDDAAPGVGAILEAYVTTLPRVLAVVASTQP